MADMITSTFLLVVYYLVYAITIPIRYFDDVTVSTTVSEAITTATHYLATWNSFLPMTAIMTVVALVLSIETIIAAYKVIMWLIRRIPTQS